MLDDDTLKAQLAELQAKRAALADAAAARAEPGLAELIAIEARKLKEDEALDAAQREHGARAVMMVRIDDQTPAVIVRRPSTAAWRKFQDTEDQSSQTAEELVRASLVYPSKPELKAVLDEVPAMVARAADAVVQLAGFRTKSVAGK